MSYLGSGRSVLATGHSRLRYHRVSRTVTIGVPVAALCSYATGYLAVIHVQMRSRVDSTPVRMQDWLLRSLGRIQVKVRSFPANFRGRRPGFADRGEPERSGCSYLAAVGRLASSGRSGVPGSREMAGLKLREAIRGMGSMTVQTEDSAVAEVSALLVLGKDQPAHIPIVKVAVSELTVAGSPRVAGENPEHVHALAEADAELPPILVHRPTMRVIDGVHRLRAAKLRGDQYISARFFSGDEKDSFVLAVQSNITHGLPLSLADRKAAAERIIQSHPQWSDRMIATVVGLAARTVGTIRKQCADNTVQMPARIGQDGRVRPINGTDGRILASELIAGNPGLSLRQIARVAGISPETVRDVRNRLGRGEDPVPGRRVVGQSDQPDQSGRAQKRTPRPAGPIVHPGPDPVSRESRAAVIGRLKADPALRFTETGRTLLRLLHVNMMQAEEWESIGANIPPHCGWIIASLARECAQMWEDLAEHVERNLADIA